MKPGEIWLAQLDPAVGIEIQKTRPCVVISPEEMNAHLRTVIVAPMTTGSRPAAFRVPLRFQGKAGSIVLVVVARQRRVDIEPGEQFLGVARVLSGDDVRFLQ